MVLVRGPEPEVASTKGPVPTPEPRPDAAARVVNMNVLSYI